MGKLLRTLSWLLAAIIGAVLLAVATVDSWLVIGERSQGGYEPPTADEKVAAEERAHKAIAAALEAARNLEASGEEMMLGEKSHSGRETLWENEGPANKAANRQLLLSGSLVELSGIDSAHSSPRINTK